LSRTPCSILRVCGIGAFINSQNLKVSYYFSPLDLLASQWDAQLVKDIPQQMNGSDCGMFTCKFAEYLSTNAAITLTQIDMPYFRKRIIWKIVKTTLLHP